MKRNHEYRVRLGLIQVFVRGREYRSGWRFTVRASRLYKDGDVWRESQRFGRDDVPVLRLALDQAHAWMLKQAGPATK